MRNCSSDEMRRYMLGVVSASRLETLPRRSRMLRRPRGALTVVTVACETKEHALVDRSRSPGFGVTLFQPVKLVVV